MIAGTVQSEEGSYLGSDFRVPLALQDMPGQRVYSFNTPEALF